MSKVEMINMLNTYLKTNVAPVLIKSFPADIFIDESVNIPADCDVLELNGHYEGIDFLPPVWYQTVLSKASARRNILVIENISSLSKDEQMKFYELLKYRKIGVFELPQNCIIVLTAQEGNQIAEDIYSLVVSV